MRALEEDVRLCKKCILHETRTNPVPGGGSIDAKIMFIGEGPGYWEDQKGKPFVGRAGKILDELLQSIGLKREDVYIANILKCRPPENRDPLPGEIKECTPYLDRQISIINPKIIATLGRFSMDYVFDKFGIEKKKISEVHGEFFSVSTINGKLFVVPLFHPAVATYNPTKKDILLKDFQTINKGISSK